MSGADPAPGGGPRGEDLPLRSRPVRSFGQAAIALGFIDEANLNRARMVRIRLESEGSRRRLGEILVGEGILTQDQVLAVLAEMGTKLAACPGCARRYNLVRHVDQAVYCPECRSMLQPLAVPDELHVDDEIDVGEEEVEVGLREVAVAGDPVPVPVEVSAARKTLAGFWRKRKPLAEGPEGPTAAGAPTRRPWVAPVSGAILVLFVATAIGVRIGRTVEPIPTAEVPAATPRRIEPIDGDVVMAFGSCPLDWPGEIVRTGEDRGFLLVFWDPPAAEALALWVVCRPEQDRLLRRRSFGGALRIDSGEFRTSPPAGVQPAPSLAGTRVVGYVVLPAASNLGQVTDLPAERDLRLQILVPAAGEPAEPLLPR